MTSERFLVPIDFSPDADGALRYASALGVPLHAHLVLSRVRDDGALNSWSYCDAPRGRLVSIAALVFPQGECHAQDPSTHSRAG